MALERYDFEQRPLRLAVNFPYPCGYENDDGTKSRNFSSMSTGGEKLLLDFMAEYFNFTVEPINCNMTFGKLINGSYTGLVGQLVTKEADFCLSHLTITPKRYSYIDFSVPYLYEPITFMINTKFVNLAPAATSVFDDKTELFFSILVAFFVSIVFIGRKMQATVPVDDGLNMFWTLFLNFLQKGLDATELPKSKTVRILVLTWLSVGLFVIAMMGGLVLSLLASAPIDKLDTLAKLEASTVQPMVPKGSYVKRAMAAIPNPLIQALLERLIETPERDYTEIQKRILQGERYALFQAKIPLKCAQKKLNERLLYVPRETRDNTVFVGFLAIGYPKGSVLKPLFDPFLLHLVETGSFRHFHYTTLLKKTNYIVSYARNQDEDKHDSEVEDSSTVPFHFLAEVFVFLSIGAILSLASSLLESIWFRNIRSLHRTNFRINRRSKQKRLKHWKTYAHHPAPPSRLT